jgi:hypothetical protein
VDVDFHAGIGFLTGVLVVDGMSKSGSKLGEIFDFGDRGWNSLLDYGEV